MLVYYKSQTILDKQNHQHIQLIKVFGCKIVKIHVYNMLKVSPKVKHHPVSALIHIG